MKKDKKKTWVIKYSCLTNKAVWVNHTPSEGAMRRAYLRARHAEEEYVRNWSKRVARRKANILRLLSDCMAALPVGAEIPPEKLEAAKRLRKEADAPQPCYLEFYNHIVEERKRWLNRKSGPVKNPA